MGFKKQNWSEYNRSGEIVEFILRDRSGAKTGSFKANNQKDYGRVLKLIKDKLGYKPELDVCTREDIDDEINWLKKEMKW